MTSRTLTDALPPLSRPLTAAEVITYLQTLAPETPVLTAISLSEGVLRLWPPPAVETAIRAARSRSER